jgi:hypothetical protein
MLYPLGDGYYWKAWGEKCKLRAQKIDLQAVQRATEVQVLVVVVVVVVVVVEVVVRAQSKKTVNKNQT